MKNININDLFTKKIDNSDIAIIGLSAKLPGANSMQDFMQILSNGVEAISDFPQCRKADIDQYFECKYGEKSLVKYKKGGYLEKIDCFDHKFFGMSPNEGIGMNPIQRILYENCWTAIDNAGYIKTIQGSKTGVYVGYMGDIEGYKYYEMLRNTDEDRYLCGNIAGNLASLLPTRISYLLDLKGPSILVDTACSSALVAVHMGCKAILRDECDMAIAGGIRISMIPIENDIKIGIESGSYKTCAFDNSADGTVSGEGVAVFLLKRLNQAMADHDNIYAVIKGSAINQDGASMGITSPNAQAQTNVILQAWLDAKIDPKDVTYIEAHGTGTPLGDPIEVSAITNAFSTFTNKKQFCGISSVKTNIGHLYEVSGAAGLLKCILSFREKTLYPCVNFFTPNKDIDFLNSSVYVINKVLNWTSNTQRLCGVSAFGFSGTNCHVVLKEHQRANIVLGSNRDWNVLALTSKSKSSLRNLMKEYKRYLLECEENMENVCYTQNVCKDYYKYRIVFVFQNKNFLINALQIYEDISSLDESKIADSIYESLDEAGSASVPLEIDDIVNQFLSGIIVDWQMIYPNDRHYKVEVPNYQFDDLRLWPDMIHFTEKSVTRNMGILRQEHQIDFSENDEEKIEQYAIHLLAQSFHYFCDKESINFPIVKMQLFKKLGIVEKYERLYVSILHILFSKGILSEIDELLYIHFDVLHAYHIEVPVCNWRLEAYKDLIDLCIPNLIQILTGKIDAVKLMFDKSSMNYVENVYHGNNRADMFNDYLSKFVKYHIDVLASKNNGRPIRVLELGAGTGATTEQILNQIGDCPNLKYYYTDISPAFLQHGKNNLEEYDFISYEILDLEREHIPDELYRNIDVIIASNVIHATKNIHASLNIAQRMLKENGVIVLNELTSNECFTTLTFGLLDGWWRYNDDNIRIANSPLLSVDQWKQSLKQCAYGNIQSLSNKSESQSIIVAQKRTYRENNPIKDTKKSICIIGKDIITETELRIGNIWCEILGYFEINVMDSFYEIGGDSILISTLHMRLEQEFPGLFTIAKIFEYPSIQAMSEFIDLKRQEKTKNDDTCLDPTDYNSLLDKIQNNDIDVQEAIQSFMNSH